jgi:hypothetical protein
VVSGLGLNVCGLCVVIHVIAFVTIVDQFFIEAYLNQFEVDAEAPTAVTGGVVASPLSLSVLAPISLYMSYLSL